MRRHRPEPIRWCATGTRPDHRTGPRSGRQDELRGVTVAEKSSGVVGQLRTGDHEQGRAEVCLGSGGARQAGGAVRGGHSLASGHEADAEQQVHAVLPRLRHDR